MFASHDEVTASENCAEQRPRCYFIKLCTASRFGYRCWSVYQRVQNYINQITQIYIAIPTVYHSYKENSLTVCEPSRLPQFPTRYSLQQKRGDWMLTINFVTQYTQHHDLAYAHLRAIQILTFFCLSAAFTFVRQGCVVAQYYYDFPAI